MNSGAAVAATAPPTGLPDPGEPVPMLAKPTVALFLGGLVVWGVSTWARLALGCPLWLVIPVNAAVSFTRPTVRGGSCGPSRWSTSSPHRLGQADLDAGYVLTCQSQPTSPEVTVDYDA
jgi:hypothetical protein